MEKLEDFLSGVKVLSFERQTAEEFGKIRNKLREEGELIGDIDTMIAATSKTHELGILTDNLKHFKKIDEIEVYKE